MLYAYHYKFAKNMEYISSYIFEGTGTNENDFLNNSLKRNENGVLVATELNERYGAIKGNLSTLLDSYISDNIISINSFASFLCNLL